MSENIRKYVEVLAALRKDRILTDKKDFTRQIGEWLVEQLYNGKRATSANQEGWDVEVDGKFIQVKTHAKAEGNGARWSSILGTPRVKVDELIIVVFTHHYKLLEFYRVPWEIAEKEIKFGLKNKRDKIKWSAVEKYRVEIDELPRQEVVGLFR